MKKSLIPNFFTSSNLGLGVLCIILAQQGELVWAAFCILGSLFADALDGRTARALGVSGEFGKELDSLADVVSFGAASAFLMYQYVLHEAGWIGIAAAVVYSVCGALRLARFNISKKDVVGFFMGVPIPTGGCFFATIVLSGTMFDPYIMSAVVLITGLLLYSEVHYPDFKGKSADPLHTSALLAVLVIGAGILYLDWHSVVFLPFALYMIYGIINTALNRK